MHNNSGLMNNIITIGIDPSLNLVSVLDRFSSGYIPFARACLKAYETPGLGLFTAWKLSAINFIRLTALRVKNDWWGIFPR